QTPCTERRIHGCISSGGNGRPRRSDGLLPNDAPLPGLLISSYPTAFRRADYSFTPSLPSEQFRASRSRGTAIEPPCDKDHAIWKQCCRVLRARGIKIGGGSPAPTCRIIQFCA